MLAVQACRQREHIQVSRRAAKIAPVREQVLRLLQQQLVEILRQTGFGIQQDVDDVGAELGCEPGVLAPLIFA